ncbi:vWA-like protein [Violaceomyces palustris]|uniref:VWA-like protein n=1 Tax=Violaceomyces palustris TaxID=1673888 RepID=A0ACD0NX23_9BASI|nr:vWA-like protein [Violaceomyces palustris]
MSAGPSRSGGVYSMFGSAAQHLADDQAAQSATASALNPWDEPSRLMDLVFIMDATGSMGSYINSATKNIETICENIIQSEQLGPGALRIGLIAYRDHPPQDHTYVVKNFGFSTEVETVKTNLKSLYASGGGDGPEAVTAAMKAALELDWRPQATKLAVLIADAPPHGIGEYGDGFPNGSPDGEDPLRLARRLAANGIPLFMVACEPALSGYHHAADFYQGLVKITGAMLVPLTTASLLSHVILGVAGEAMDMERLHREIGDAVAERLRALSLEGGQSNPMDDVARELHERLLLRNESTKQLYIESIYRDSEESRHNIEVWSQAPDVASAKPHIKKVSGSRLSDKYLAQRRAHSSYTPYTPFPHPPSTPANSSANKPGSRKVVSTFSTFSASPGIKVETAGSPPSGHSPALGTAAGGFATSPRLGMGNFRGRDTSMEEDDEDDEDQDGEEDEEEDENRGRAGALPIHVSPDGIVQVEGEDGQKLAYRQGAISLDQVRRLAMQSAYRGGLGSS